MTREELIEALQAKAAADRHVRALFLSGSLGSGGADRFADVDTVLVVAPEDHPAFVAALPEWVSDLFAPVLWRQLFPPHPLFHAVSPEWQRLDLTVTVPAHLNGTRVTWRPMHDPDGLYAQLPERPADRAPDPKAVLAIVEEFLRIVALLPVGVGRSEHVVGASGVFLLRGQLIALLTEAHAPPLPPGALHLTRILAPDEIALLEALPPVAATRESVIAGSLAVAAAFLPRAKTLVARLGAEWPEALETAARAHIRRELGLELPG